MEGSVYSLIIMMKIWTIRYPNNRHKPFKEHFRVSGGSMKVQSIDNSSSLSDFAHNVKAVDKKRIYKRALNAAKDEQLLMIKQSKNVIY